MTANRSGIADDLDGDPVFLARNQFYLDYTRERAAGIVVHRHQGCEEGQGGGVSQRPSLRRHGRIYSGHPRLAFLIAAKEDVDARLKAGHDEG